MENNTISTKKYKAKRKGLIHFILVGLVLLPFVLVQVNVDLIQETPWVLLPFLAPLALVLWLYLGTSYQIEEEHLLYRSGFIKGKIPISSIREIQNGKTLWAGLKPALSTGGIVIKFGKFDEIYLAPESNSELIHDLLEINPRITVSFF
jgi:hypothetical protein